MSDLAAVRVLIVDDHKLFREGLRILLSDKADVVVVGEASSAEQALALVGQRQPQVVLLDVTLPGMNGIAATRAMRERYPGLAVVILTMHRDDEYIATALSAGAAGYVLKESASGGELVLAITAAARGELFLSPSISHRLVPAFVRSSPAADDLTPRQLEVVRLLARGMTTKQVAAALNLSTKTVETHRAAVMEKLGLRGVAGLVLYAVRTGLISVNDADISGTRLGDDDSD